MPDTPTASRLTAADLADTLVLTTRKHVWNDSACEVFPARLNTWQVYGYSTNKLNSWLLFSRTLPTIYLRRPRVILIAAAARLQGWLAQCRRRGLIRSRLVVINRGYPEYLAPYIDRCIHDTRLEAAYHGKREGTQKHVYMPWGIDFFREVEKRAAPDISREQYILVPGWTGRDFPTLMKTAELVPQVRFVITTNSRATIAYPDPFPANVTVRYGLPEPEFIDLLRGCLCVVLPLKSHAIRIHLSGGGTIVKTLQAGKPLITQAYHDDYMTENENGLFVPPEDSAALAEATLKYWNAPDRAAELADSCRTSGMRFTYKTYAQGLAAVCHALRGDNDTSA